MQTARSVLNLLASLPIAATAASATYNNIIMPTYNTQKHRDIQQFKISKDFDRNFSNLSVKAVYIRQEKVNFGSICRTVGNI